MFVGDECVEVVEVAVPLGKMPVLAELLQPVNSTSVALRSQGASRAKRKESMPRITSPHQQPEICHAILQIWDGERPAGLEQSVTSQGRYSYVSLHTGRVMCVAPALTLRNTQCAVALPGVLLLTPFVSARYVFAFVRRFGVISYLSSDEIAA